MKKELSTNKEKFLALVSKEPCNIMDEIKWRIDNRYWIRKMQTISIKVLFTLAKKNIPKADLALKMGISYEELNTILKGSTDISLSTICKLEEALNIKLLVKPNFNKPKNKK